MNSMTQEKELVPPDQDRVFKRALVLLAVSCRGMIESDSSRTEVIGLWERVKAWAIEQGIETELEPQEAELIHTPIGNLDRQRAVDAGWRCEGMAVLAWALSSHEAFPHDVQANPRSVADSLGF